jgi:hypothetical protein
VANSRSSEAFVAMCLLTVTGTSLLTQKLGFSDTVSGYNLFTLASLYDEFCLQYFRSQLSMFLK